MKFLAEYILITTDSHSDIAEKKQTNFSLKILSISLTL